MTASLPQLQVEGVASVRYRCAGCGDLMDPADAVLVDGQTWHIEHAPKEAEHGG